MKNFLIFNGEFKENDELLIPVNSRAFRYGDGLFETMKVVTGRILLEAFHFERLTSGIKEMAFHLPEGFIETLKHMIVALLAKNDHLKRARVRLMVFRGNGNLYDNEFDKINFIIESLALPDIEAFNEVGLRIDIYGNAYKCYDAFSALKTNNFLPYSMAAIYAKQHHLNDCLLMNTEKRICDATIANVFVIQNKQIYTPSISEGCIAGVMRRYLLEKLPALGFVINETFVTADLLTDADELFLTNAISGIRWVGTCGNVRYKKTATAIIYNELIKSLFQ